MHAGGALRTEGQRATKKKLKKNRTSRQTQEGIGHIAPADRGRHGCDGICVHPVNPVQGLCAAECTVWLTHVEKY